MVGDIGQIILTLCVGVFKLTQAGEELLGVEDVDAHVQLVDLFLLGGAVPVFHDAFEAAVFIPDDAAVGKTAVGNAGEDGAVVAGLLMDLYKVFVGLFFEEGHIAVADQNGSIVVF